jgi:serine/threonine protein phosphatase PrpC
MNIAIVSAAGSDVGQHRDNNEDSAYAGPWLLAVADGMGGYAGGEVASSAAIGVLRSIDAEVAATELADRLVGAVTHANEELCRVASNQPELARMGTTLTAMLWSGAQVAVAHIGDSRCYLRRAGELVQLTDDHTMDRLLGGRPTDADTDSPPLSHVLFRVLDGRPDRTPDVMIHTARPGDRYLLCSDGLTDAIDDTVIHEVLATAPDSATAVRRLIDLANQAGGPDNITCVVADVVEGAAAPRVTPVIVGAAAALP